MTVSEPIMSDVIEKWTLSVSDPVIAYVLVRTDTPGEPSIGRLGAQTHHCGTQMTEDMLGKNFPDLNDLYDEWQRDAALELAAARAMQALRDASGHVDGATKVSSEEHARLQDVVVSTREAADKAKRSFGTVLTLAVNAAQMRNTVNFAQLMGFHAGITHDPTYPIFLKDGDRTIITTAPVDSCAYIFGRKSAVRAVVGQFDLLSERHFA